MEVVAKDRFRVGMGQVRPVLGDVAANLRGHLDMVRDAIGRGADAIVFPELSLTGYGLKDLAFDVALPVSDERVQDLVEASRGIDILFGFVEVTAGHLFYVTSLYASQGRIAHAHRKLYLPTYGLFEDGRHYARGRSLDTFSTRFGRAGIAICEDAWHPSVPYLLSVAGCEVLYIPAASPGRAPAGDPDSGSQAFWDRLVRAYAQLFTVYVVFVNRVGFEDGVHFFGYSTVAGPGGELVGASQSSEEGLTLVDLDLQTLRRARFETPLLRDEDPHFTLRMLHNFVGG